MVAPCAAADAKGLLKAAIRDDNPVLFLENELLYGRTGEVPEGDHVAEIGAATVLREGADVTLVSFSRGVERALEAAELLAAEGISAEVIDLRSLRPLDIDTVTASARRTNRVVTIEDGWSAAGIGAEIAAQVMERAFDHLDAPVQRVSGANAPMPYAANLERLALPDADRIAAAAKRVCYR